MATNIHDHSDHLATVSQTMALLSSVSRRQGTMFVLGRLLEREARAVYEEAGHYQDADFGVRLESVADGMGELAGFIRFTPARRSVLRAAIWLAKAARVAKGEDPDAVPELVPTWRALLHGYGALFKIASHKPR